MYRTNSLDHTQKTEDRRQIQVSSHFFFGKNDRSYKSIYTSSVVTPFL